MSDREPGPSLMPRLLLVAGASIAMGLTVAAIHRVSVTSEQATAIPAVDLVTAGPPIAAEADVYRTRVGLTAAAVSEERRPGAHPRTLATFRALRAYPGAPPRVPHGLTPVEFRTNRCTTCHERGGYSQRFGAYAPMTPHPELASCLSCHATNSILAGVPLPKTGPNDACRQCHVGVPALFRETGVNWQPAAWPAAGVRDGSVPAIPHDLAMRGNCVACHSGPGAVVEIRTTHPERADCRQCHVASGSDAGAYVRSVVATARSERTVP